MKRAVIYARVSTVEQAEEGYSIDAQLDMVKNKCVNEGRVVVDNYVDRGISGKSLKNRLALQRLLEDIKNGEIDEVWVWKTNRLARNHLDLLNIVNIFDKYNVAFKSCTEPFETNTATGKLLLNLLASIGEFERETIVDNVKMGHKERAKRGEWNGGRVLGYDSISLNEDEEKKVLVINKEEAIIVKKIYDLYLGGLGLKAITNKMNKEGYKTKKNNFFSISGIKEILLNPLYCGKIRYNYRENWSEKRRRGINKNPIIVEGKHEAIIPKEKWEEVQCLFKSKSKIPSRVFDGSYLLTGLLKCPVCGASMVAGRAKTKTKNGEVKVIRYYHCGNWRNKGSAVCKSNGIRADKAEEFIINKINNILKNENLLNEAVNKFNNKNLVGIEPIEEEIKLIDTKLKSLNSKKNKIFELFEDGIIEKETLKLRIKILEESIELNLKRKKELVEKIRDSTTTKVTLKEVKIVLNRISDIFNKFSKENQKMLLHLLIEKITINEKREIKSISIKFNDEVNEKFIKINKGEPLGSPFSFYIEF
ncbi:TPA: recombinase family protein [Clostridium perfringens]